MPPSSGDNTSPERRPERRLKSVRKRAWGRYVCEIRLPCSRQRIWLSSYATAEEAACAYDAASLYLRGKTASLNFPSFILSPVDSNAIELPLYSREEIQSIAATAAARCRSAEKLLCTLTELPLSSDAQQSESACKLACFISAMYTESESRDRNFGRPVHNFRHPIRRHLALEDVKEMRMQVSSVRPLQQHWSSLDETQVTASAAEDEQCVFSILKELVPLPRITNAHGAPIWY